MLFLLNIEFINREIYKLKEEKTVDLIHIYIKKEEAKQECC